VLQTCANPFAQNLPFKFRKDRQQTGHRPTGWRCQIQCLCQGNRLPSVPIPVGSPADP
jgi:hypothetical protein